MNVETVADTVVSVINETAFQTIFETNFSGLALNRDDRSDYDEHFITRVEDSSLLFSLDSPDTKNENITIEKAGEYEQLREEEREKARANPQLTEEEKIVLGEEIYMNSCAACHAQDLSGAVGPSLRNVGNSFSVEEIHSIIVNGKDSMPSIYLTDDEAALVADWLLDR